MVMPQPNTVSEAVGEKPRSLDAVHLHRPMANLLAVEPGGVKPKPQAYAARGRLVTIDRVVANVQEHAGSQK
jgi:hypothetical protein